MPDLPRLPLRLECVLLALWLGACTTVTAPPDATAVLHDELFPQATVPIDAGQLFALSPAMRIFLQQRLDHPGRPARSLEALVQALSQEDALRLRYESSRTRTAAEAFDEHAGNCLSLVMLTASFAHALGLPVTYHVARTDPYWSRQGNLLLASGHVDLTVGLPLDANADGIGRQAYTFDFISAEEAQALPLRDIPEDTLVAMFFNNRAAEALVAGQPARAYGWVRQALQRDPGFAAAYNTLGVVYLRADASAAAAQAFAAALALDTDNPRVLSNLVDAQRALGNTAEAERLAARLALLEPDPPYRLFDLGVAAFARRDFAGARALFRRAAAHADYDPELHFWLARTASALGAPAQAQREVELALERSTTASQRSRFAAKLDWLRGQAQRND